MHYDNIEYNTENLKKKPNNTMTETTGRFSRFIGEP